MDKSKSPLDLSKEKARLINTVIFPLQGVKGDTARKLLVSLKRCGIKLQTIVYNDWAMCHLYMFPDLILSPEVTKCVLLMSTQKDIPETPYQIVVSALKGQPHSFALNELKLPYIVVVKGSVIDVYLLLVDNMAVKFKLHRLRIEVRDPSLYFA